MSAELRAVQGESQVDGRPELSRKQRMILDFIRDHVRDLGYPPTVREIGERIEVSSTSTVVWHLRELERKGYLQRRDDGRRGRGQSRALRIVPGPGESTSTPEDLEQLEMDLTDAWHQLSRADLGDVSLAEFLQLRPDEQDAWARDGARPARLQPYWRWLHRSLGLPAGDRR